MSGDWRSAFDVYVAGRNRGVTIEQKFAMAELAPILAGTDGSAPPQAASAEIAGAAKPTFGVEVPADLTFHRNAGTWTSRLPGSSGARPHREKGHDV